jgi:hypothetical protein
MPNLPVANRLEHARMSVGRPRPQQQARRHVELAGLQTVSFIYGIGFHGSSFEFTF